MNTRYRFRHFVVSRLSYIGRFIITGKVFINEMH